MRQTTEQLFFLSKWCELCFFADGAHSTGLAKYDEEWKTRGGMRGRWTSGGGGEERRGGGDGELSGEAVVCVLDEGMEGVNPFLHHYLVSATALTLISLRATRLARSLPHPSIHPSTPFKPLCHHPPLLPPHPFHLLVFLPLLSLFPPAISTLPLSLSRCASSLSLWKLTEIPNP